MKANGNNNTKCGPAHCSVDQSRRVFHLPDRDSNDRQTSPSPLKSPQRMRVMTAHLTDWVIAGVEGAKNEKKFLTTTLIITAVWLFQRQTCQEVCKESSPPAMHSHWSAPGEIVQRRNIYHTAREIRTHKMTVASQQMHREGDGNRTPHLDACAYLGHSKTRRIGLCIGNRNDTWHTA